MNYARTEACDEKHDDMGKGCNELCPYMAGLL